MNILSGAEKENSFIQHKTNAMFLNKLTLAERKKIFEEEIEKNSNTSDPIDPWHKYLKWAKHHLNNNSNVANEYETLLDIFLAKFLNSCQYKNDPRYVNAWLDKAQDSNNAEEKFAYMRKHNIGVTCASFYIAWADEYEKNGDFESAKALYSLGVQQQAQPYETIYQMKVAFEEKISQKKKVTNLSSHFLGSELLLDENKENESNLVHSLDDILNMKEDFPFQESIEHKQIRSLYGESIANTCPMYPMKKVYSHVGEFQFEEVIAAKWRRKHNQDIKNIKKTSQQMSSENIAKQHEKLARRQKQLSDVLNAINSKFGLDIPQCSNDMTVNIKNMCLQLQQCNVNKADNDIESLPNSVSDHVGVMNDSTDNAVCRSPALACSFQENSTSKVHDVSKLAQPSPTLCTKEAIGDIMDMFRQPLMEDIEKESKGNIDPSNLSILFNDDVKTKPKSFALFAEDNNLDTHTNKQSSRFNIFCDDEPQGERFSTEKSTLQKKTLEKVRFNIFCDDESQDEKVSTEKNTFQQKKLEKVGSLMYSKNVDLQNVNVSENNPSKFEIFCDNESFPKDAVSNVSTLTANVNSSNAQNDFEIFRDDNLSDLELLHKKSSVSLMSSQKNKSGLFNESYINFQKELSCRGSNKPFDIMSETILAGQSEQLAEKISDKDGFQNISCEKALAESTSYKFDLTNVKNSEIFLEKCEKKASEKYLSPIIEEGSGEINLTSKDHFTKESIFSQGLEINDPSDISMPSLQSIELSHTCTTGVQDTLDIEMQPGHASVSQDSISQPNHSLNFSKASSRISPLNIVNDPWDEDVRKTEAKKMLLNCPKVFWLKKKAPSIQKGSTLIYDSKRFSLVDTLGKGGFATVYLVADEQEKTHAMKVEYPSCEWEVFAMETAMQRLRKSNHSLLHDVFIDIQNSVIFSDASWIFTEYVPHGTLLDFVNNTSKLTKISLLQYHQICLQILKLVDALHSVQIIHADVKPDNFLVCSNYQYSYLKEVPKLKLIDFGCSIDMNLFSSNTAFRKCRNTSAFVCPQMKLNLPWNYHTDYFGIASTIFLVISSNYMKIVQSKTGQWKPSDKLPRWTDEMWKEMFCTLLNFPVPSNELELTYENSPLPTLINKFNQAITRLQM